MLMSVLCPTGMMTGKVPFGFVQQSYCAPNTGPLVAYGPPF